MFGFINRMRARRVARQQMDRALSVLVACAAERKQMRQRYGSPFAWPADLAGSIETAEIQALAEIRELRHLI